MMPFLGFAIVLGVWLLFIGGMLFIERVFDAPDEDEP